MHNKYEVELFWCFTTVQADSSKDKKRGSYQPQPSTLLADAGNIKCKLMY